MPAVDLASLLQNANARRSAVAGLVVLGWEDARAYVAAAEELDLPVILQAGPGCRAHQPVELLGPMFRWLADRARVPVCCHIDHATTVAQCQAGIEAGFTSVMIDGSMLPLAENIALTCEVVALARPRGISVEGEIGFVGYTGPERGEKPSLPTDPEQARQFAEQTGVDALAVSVGNVHLATEPTDGINLAALRAIEAALGQLAHLPLVLHGSSGIPPAQRQQLARETRVAKFNIGTELRQTFGASLRRQLADKPGLFDRLALLAGTENDSRAAARAALLSCVG